MKNIFIHILFFACAVFIPKMSLAALSVNEIMYDPPGSDTNHEWIEIVNDGDVPIDISGWKLFEGTSNHALISVLGSTTIPAHGFAVIADNATTFQTDWPTFGGVLFDSVFSLANSGETFSLKDSSGAVINEVTYTSASGANGDGESLVGADAVWVAAIATPGAINVPPNEENPADEQDDENENGNNTTNTENETQQNSGGAASTPKAQKTITAKIGIPVGTILYDSSITLSAEIIGIDGVPVKHGYIVWNFGDGEGLTTINTNPVMHIYNYPGRYVVQIIYYENIYDREPKVTSRTTITVTPPKIEFSDNGLTFSLKNSGKTEIDISFWKIQSADYHFIFPEGTYLLASGLIILEKKKIGLPDIPGYRLMYPNTLPVPLLIPEIEIAPKVSESKIIDVVERLIDPQPVTTEPDDQIVDIPETEPFIPIIENLHAYPKLENSNPTVAPIHEENSNKKKILSPRIILLFAGVVSMGVFVSLFLLKKEDVSEDSTA